MIDKKIGILLTSRNNYSMLEEWCALVNREGFPVLNIDEDSNLSNKEFGKAVCKYNDIHYMDREERGLQNNLTTATNYFKELGIEWFIWFQHDCWPLTGSFFTKFNSMADSGKLDEFGTVGFNVLNGDWELTHWDPATGHAPLMTTARSPLEIGDDWYRHPDKYPDKEGVNYANFFTTPFAVESICWTSIALNCKQFTKHIEPCSDYQFYHAWDDICFQFLNKNVYNIVIPWFHMGHNQEIKRSHGIAISSSQKDHPLREHYFGKWGHLDVWEERWGFRYGERDTFEAVKDRYKGTLLERFYNHCPNKRGPLETFPM